MGLKINPIEEKEELSPSQQTDRLHRYNMVEARRIAFLCTAQQLWNITQCAMPYPTDRMNWPSNPWEGSKSSLTVYCLFP